MIKTGFKSEWKSFPTLKPITFDNSIFTPRPWQEDFFQQINNSDKFGVILNTPTGAGKSKAICYVSSNKLRDYKQKIIIAVPQNNIGKSFINNNVIKYKDVDGEYQDFFISNKNNLCNDSIDDNSKVDHLLNFINLDTENVNHRNHNRIIVVTHSTLALTFKSNPNIKNILLWIDEAHHVKTHIDSYNEYTNRLGEIVRYFINNKDNNNSVGLVTATLYRGDKFNIIPENNINDFENYSLPYDKHFEDNCQYLKSFTYDFKLTDNNWEESIYDLVNENDKSIVFIPHTSSIHIRNNLKMASVDNIISKLDDNNSVFNSDDVVTKIKHKGKDFNIINLVDDDSKRRNMRLEYLHSNKDDVDMIITMNVFTEGSDWDIANKVIIVGARSSITMQMQMIGRAFRDHISKKDKPISIVQVIPNVDENSVSMLDHKNINDYMKCIYSSFIFEMMFNPIKINTKNSKSTTKQFSILDVFNSESDYFNFFDEIMEELIICKVEFDDTSLTNKEKNDNYSKIISRKLLEYGVDYHDEISSYIINKFKSRTKNTSTIVLNTISNDLKNINFDCVYEDDCLNFIKSYTTGICGINTLKEFRNTFIDHFNREWYIMYDKIKYEVNNNKTPINNLDLKSKKWISHQVEYHNKGKLDPKRYNLLNKIDGFVWIYGYSERWFKKANELKQYMLNGNEFPTKSNVEFGNWVNKARQNKRLDKLSYEQIEFLESIPNWFWDVDYSSNFITKVNKIKDIVDTTGILPTNKHPEIGIFIDSIRAYYKKNKLTSDQVKLVESIPNWFWCVDYNKMFWDKANKLKQFILDGNEFPTKSNKEFGSWVNKIRNKYKHKLLNVDQISFLNSIPGFFWSVNHYDAWIGYYNDYRKLKVSNSEIPRNLMIWAKTQRFLKKNNELSIDKIKLLEDIPGWFWEVDFDSVWWDKANRLKSYMLDGNTLPSESNKELGGFVIFQRRSKKNNKLTIEQIEFLESIPNWFWDKRKDRVDDFNNYVERLKKYISDGNPFPTKSNKEFGNWVRYMREKIKDNKLSKDQVKCLKSIKGFIK